MSYKLCGRATLTNTWAEVWNLTFPQQLSKRQQIKVTSSLKWPVLSLFQQNVNYERPSLHLNFPEQLSML